MGEIAITYEGDLSTRAVHSDSGVELFTDAPKDHQGLGRFFSPTDLLATALGTCMMTMMGAVAKRLNIDIKGMRARVTKEMAVFPARRIGKIEIIFTCPSNPQKRRSQNFFKQRETAPCIKASILISFWSLAILGEPIEISRCHRL